MKKVPLPILGVLLLTPILILALREFSLQPDGMLRVHFLDVGQGDATLLISPSGKQILIDGGPDLSTLEHLGRTLPFFDRTIELLVLTHPNLDHLAAFPELIKRYTVKRILLSGVQEHLGMYEALLVGVTQYGIPITLARIPLTIDFNDGLLFDVLWPTKNLVGKAVKNVNNTSMVIRAVFGGSSILLTGDIEREGERGLLLSAADLSSTLVKVPHHGSKTSSSREFLLATHPSTAIISSGKENRYGHPHSEVLVRLRELGIPFRSTANEGTISFTLPPHPL